MLLGALGPRQPRSSHTELSRNVRWSFGFLSATRCRRPCVFPHFSCPFLFRFDSCLLFDCRIVPSVVACVCLPPVGAVLDLARASLLCFRCIAAKRKEGCCNAWVTPGALLFSWRRGRARSYVRMGLAVLARGGEPILALTGNVGIRQRIGSMCRFILNTSHGRSLACALP